MAMATRVSRNKRFNVKNHVLRVHFEASYKAGGSGGGGGSVSGMVHEPKK